MAEYSRTNPVLFTEEMRKTYTILAPTMLPLHFQIIANIFNSQGYHMEILETSGRQIIETGLKYVHNDTCYPALIVIGQLIDALNSGKYDINKVALMISQTGGGCRASNYLSLLRKALAKAGYGHIPVISLNVAGLEKHPGFKLNLTIGLKLLYGVLCGDLMMLLRNQCRPYEIEEGSSERLAKRWADRISEQLCRSSHISYKKLKQSCARMIREFEALPRRKEKKVKIGIVGEIYVKFSPLGNNNLEEFLLSEGAEPVMPGLLDFCLYCVYNSVIDYQLYGIEHKKAVMFHWAFRYLIKKEKDIIQLIRENSSFEPMTPFDHTVTLADGLIGMGAKMGEGWLLTAEMAELAESGCAGIVCTQPFGCLPNHIAGKGMMKPLRDRYPDVSIVAIDYDPGATQINQENRIKLMLANAAGVL
ncbi:MAG: 2-hydroxyglutaryl-CoA dehydratase [Oscillospiraceae bacterium]|jgi:predicted nucleotide-binding protein (sugar kinase/HSP70/actin superfamily)